MNWQEKAACAIYRLFENSITLTRQQPQSPVDWPNQDDILAVICHFSAELERREQALLKLGAGVAKEK